MFVAFLVIICVCVFLFACFVCSCFIVFLLVFIRLPTFIYFLAVSCYSRLMFFVLKFSEVSVFSRLFGSLRVSQY